MDAMIRRVVVLAVALGLTLLLFLGAGYFGAVWTHYFAGEPQQKSSSEVSVKILPAPTAGNGLCNPKTRKCPEALNSTAPKPHE
jgi:hypothetical protein